MSATGHPCQRRGAAAPDQVFEAPASEPFCEWWVRPGVSIRGMVGDVRPGPGARVWEAENPCVGGEFLEVDAPVRLIHTWQLSVAPGSRALCLSTEAIDEVPA